MVKILGDNLQTYKYGESYEKNEYLPIGQWVDH